MTLHAQLTLANGSSKTAKAKGNLGERIARSFFQAHGFKVRKLTEKTRQGDLRVTRAGIAKTFEIKVSTYGKRGYQFCMKRDGRKNKGQYLTDCAYADFVLLICSQPSGACVFFLIPSHVITTKKINIRNPLNTPKFDRYRIGD